MVRDIFWAEFPAEIRHATGSPTLPVECARMKQMCSQRVVLQQRIQRGGELEYVCRSGNGKCASAAGDAAYLTAHDSRNYNERIKATTLCEKQQLRRAVVRRFWATASQGTQCCFNTKGPSRVEAGLCSRWCWWQVRDSNSRSRRRLIYSQIPLATWVTCHARRPKF